jgi:hypothetical protein
MNLMPSRKQYQEWSTLNKCTYISGVLGIMIGFASLALGFLSANSSQEEENMKRLIFHVVQDLRYNHEWLSKVAVAYEKRYFEIPPGYLRVDSLLLLAYLDYSLLTQYAYGEEKNIYQEILNLKNLGETFGRPMRCAQIDSFENQTPYCVQDIIFLNDFFLWYLRPLVDETLQPQLIRSLYCPNTRWTSRSYVPGIEELRLKYFVAEGEPIIEFIDYLGILD